MQALFRGLSFTGGWMRGLLAVVPSQGLQWGAARINRHSISTVLRYAAQVVVPPFRPTSVFGFALLVGIYIQMYSGFLLALYYLPDPSFTIAIREDLMLEVWWFLYVYKAHVIGVDLLFVLSYLHILKKIYLRNYSEGDLDGWFTGAYAFLVYHLVVFLGITLSTNHLGDVTIMIAANIYWSLFFRWHKVYAPFFSNKHLSTDQLTRFMIAHYLSAWYYTYLVQTHVLFVHEMWDADANRSVQQTTSTPKSTWLWDALKKEGLTMVVLYLTFAAVFFLMAHPDARVVNYSFFEQWSETEMEEINFFIVAPHWYFRPHMGLLTVCAHHYEGLTWFVSFYLLLCYMPHVYRFWGRVSAKQARADAAPLRQSPVQELCYFGLVCSMFYVGGTLPCGRFYYENVDGFFGNSFLRLSYEYVYLYLGLIAHVADRLERLYCSAAAQRRRLVLIVGPDALLPYPTWDLQIDEVLCHNVTRGSVVEEEEGYTSGSDDEDEDSVPPRPTRAPKPLWVRARRRFAEWQEERYDVWEENMESASRVWADRHTLLRHLFSADAWHKTWSYLKANPRCIWTIDEGLPLGVYQHLSFLAFVVGLVLGLIECVFILWLFGRSLGLSLY